MWLGDSAHGRPLRSAAQGPENVDDGSTAAPSDRYMKMRSELTAPFDKPIAKVESVMRP